MRILEFICLASLLYGQSQPEAPRKQFKMSVEANPKSASPDWKPAAASRAPGDDVQVDPVTGDLVVKGSGSELHVQRRSHVNPEFAVRYSRTPNGVRYSYTLANGKDASQFIQLFTMDIRKVPILDKSAPPYWWFAGIGEPVATNLNDPTMMVIMWGRHAADDEENGKLLPGLTAGPFTLESSALPGLIKVYAEGSKPHPPLGTASEEAKLEGFSPWVQEQANQALRFPANAASCYAIGPKVSASGDRLSNVKAELAFAAQLPQFASMSASLIQVLELNSVSAVKQALSQLNATSVQKPFLDAMMFALDY